MEISMTMLGFELEDVFCVLVSIALGLLTVYRRELSCNRGYHPDDHDENIEGGYLQHLVPQAGSLQERDWPTLRVDCNSGSRSYIPPRLLIRRHRSLSALHSTTSCHNDREHHHLHNFAESKKMKLEADPTEELLESAGLFLSGGPFLAAAIAVFDHLLFTSFISYFASVSSLLCSLKLVWSNVSAVHNDMLPSEGDEDIFHSFLATTQDMKTDTRIEEKQQEQFYSVGWNAVTGYFTSISTKLKDNNNNPSPLYNGDGCYSSRGICLISRSKSTGNLQQHLSIERSRVFLREILFISNVGGMDVTLLPSDAQISIFLYLPPQDILAFESTNKAGRNLLEDRNDIAEENNNSPIRVKKCDTALLIWKALFQRDYSWVLSDWEIGNEAFLRSMRNDGNQDQQLSKGCNVFRHLVSMILGSDHNDFNRNSNMIPSMKDFYFTFTETWLNYTIAGCNSTEKCLIGLHGHVFEISNFVEQHPGSTDTLLLQAGRDATVFFESIGHSTNARQLAIGMCVVMNAQCARCHSAVSWDESARGRAVASSRSLCRIRAGALAALQSTWGLINPSSISLDIKRSAAGFLIPRKRSRPRVQGGLYRIRERIQHEEEVQLVNAARWGEEVLGRNGLFGGVQVYYDPFCGWRWWYTAPDFTAVFIVPPLLR